MYYVSEHPVWYLYRTKRAIAACNRDLRVGVRLAVLSEIWENFMFLLKKTFYIFICLQSILIYALTTYLFVHEQFCRR